MKNKKVYAILFAVLAAVFYALNMPFSKLLLKYVPSTLMAGFLYLGAGIGVGLLFLCTLQKTNRAELLSKADLPYTIGMVILDILAPILLMYGLLNTTSANASLLNNFEIVATTVIALVVFKESVSKELWLAIAFVTLSSGILSFEDLSGFQFSWGSLFVLAAAICWGFENNCTRSISSKNTFEIVTIKGIGSGSGSLIIGLIIGQKLPAVKYILLVMLLGFVAYGLSILFYIKAQKELGAAKTSAYYAIAPFVGAFLSFTILKEPFSPQYFIALVLMLAGSIIATIDTLRFRHRHTHTHMIAHTHGGNAQEVTHTHMHSHYIGKENHHHLHFVMR
jgi:drug/metabolite transporter (DMT)-like permease